MFGKTPYLLRNCHIKKGTIITYHPLKNQPNITVSPAITIDTILISFIRMLSDGPDVSLNGSPTVSPTTVALWQSEFLPPRCPSSTYFLALSQAPPELARNTASTKPEPRPPASRPITPATPRQSPVSTGTAIAINEGNIISLCAPKVEISTQRA